MNPDEVVDYLSQCIIAGKQDGIRAKIRSIVTGAQGQANMYIELGQGWRKLTKEVLKTPISYGEHIQKAQHAFQFDVVNPTASQILKAVRIITLTYRSAEQSLDFLEEGTSDLDETLYWLESAENAARDAEDALLKLGGQMRGLERSVAVVESNVVKTGLKFDRDVQTATNRWRVWVESFLREEGE